MKADLQRWASELGFSQIGVASVDLSSSEEGFLAWLEAGFAGSMAYMHRHGLKRMRPAELVPGTVSVITVRMNYLPKRLVLQEEPPKDWRSDEWQRLHQPDAAVVSVYARGRDYHKVMRARLADLVQRLSTKVGPLGYRVFADSAPVAEVELAQRSGLGWRGKHTLLLNRQGGSMFFLGEIFVDIPLQPTQPVSSHCGQCSACIDVCPTGAIVAPYRLDARRCISYLTIEHEGAIPIELRGAIGNRIYGCDDCQLVCPWNKYAQRSSLPDFEVRPHWQGAELLPLWFWDEATFLQKTEGSAIRRIGYERWQRNLAVALGNARRAWLAQGALVYAPEKVGLIEAALQQRLPIVSSLVREHTYWALGLDNDNE